MIRELALATLMVTVTSLIHGAGLVLLARLLARDPRASPTHAFTSFSPPTDPIPSVSGGSHIRKHT